LLSLLLLLSLISPLTGEVLLFACPKKLMYIQARTEKKKEMSGRSKEKKLPISKMRTANNGHFTSYRIMDEPMGDA
jgi:hypothetical protein